MLDEVADVFFAKYLERLAADLVRDLIAECS